MLVKVPVMRGIQLLDHLHVVDANLSPAVNKNRHTLSEALVSGCAVDELVHRVSIFRAPVLQKPGNVGDDWQRCAFGDHFVFLIGVEVEVPIEEEHFRVE